MVSLVTVQACASYDPETVQANVRACFDALGGLERYVRPGATVFCKVNLLVPALPEQAVTTHPEVVRAVLREIKRVGGVPMVGDNPAMAKTATALRRSGILAVMEEEGVPLPDLSESVVLEYPEGRIYKRFEVSKAILEADVLLNLPKLKTHAFAYMTVAVKNLFGLVPGLEKARWHFKAQNPLQFATAVVDLYGALSKHYLGSKTLLHLCDGILAMEGDGPGTGGKPRQLGALLASTDGVALDRVACALVGLEPERLLMVQEAGRRGMGQARLEQLQLSGTPLSQWEGTHFLPAPGVVLENAWSARMMRSPWLKNRMLERPVLTPEPCVGCRKCEQICPATAIAMGGKPLKPAIDLNACIRCYCCAEVCPEGALHKSDTPWLGRFMRWLA